jgi:hypothetical protein
MAKHHHAAQVAYMKAVGSGVNTQIRRGHLFLQLFLSPGHDGMYHTAPGQLFYKIHISIDLF